jgi:hypothetical protein
MPERYKKLILKKHAGVVDALLLGTTRLLEEVLPIDAFFALKFKKETYDALKEKTIAKIAKKLKTTDLGRAKREMEHYVNIYKISNKITSKA